ncbi:helix-turn-helix transcriptional regulator [Paracrocinitomix mangrovi]|uniref:winged helix-turn-helix transcriptional regulator n=1 Tax=Paracrocinitomix mangrovi TaxID=2862509 RepID=UPI001C8E73B8|nr:helix-turn-helix domain-containing protein [Paracrocinitomix mangrovi]UKN03833.1 helix-turn-helix transcriptional regulator [Paracrocinitomix mangrovi]
MIIDGEKYKYRMNQQDFHCALDVTMHFIGGKWKAIVLWYLRNGKLRFSELKERIPDITDKMLSLQLKALEEDGVIKRTVYPQVPPKVEYEYTEEGKSLIPVVKTIADWGRVKAEKEGRLVKMEE